MPSPLLQVVIGSTRPGRMGLPVAEWFVGRAREHGGFEVEVVDLAEVDLPLLDEPNHPRFGRYVNDHTKAWSATIARGDAYVFVHPEYNYGVNAALKNAIDYLNAEWTYKPVGFVSYGGVSGGLRAAQMLKQIVNGLQMVSVKDTVIIPFVGQHVTDGVFQPTDIQNDSATMLLDELVTFEGALRPLRVKPGADA